MTALDRPPIKPTPVGRLFEGQTSIDFIGRRRVGVIISVGLLAATVLSLLTQGLNLGIDFEGGVSWDVPANEFDVDDAAGVLGDNGLSTEGARLQRRSSDSGDFIKVQVGDQTEEVGAELRAAFAEAANVPIDDVNVNLVSSSWGAEITDKAIRALLIFIVVVAAFISIRFEWRMAIAAIVAMVHDVVISVGIYSIFQFVVTPPTVIAFLTILGYSLYDTIVVFDRVKENEARYAGQKPPYDDIINVSMNQVLMRSLSTSFSSIVPVVSMLLIGSGLLGQTTLAEFALALLVGMVTGAYSSIFVAAPLLAMLKRTDSTWEERNIHRAVGDALRDMVMGGNVGSRRTRETAAAAPTSGGRRARGADGGKAGKAGKGGEGGTAATSPKAGAKAAAAASSEDAKPALSHPPRPRKKKRR
ncbi:MAG: protein translocase subunit SecF [Ilumatobacter sp.]|uniref:protein translocase subunit SecF n=1 Tax=Ilumatobacter sp. TaxID=1967498 RepID=UPI0026135100|nr:protein translocase subunit SecF [Ilumatobacter sp.]MDJ0767392.1 protein translocase subunit SecF [Ilumatobacter sp.]